jgi:hypothetical protein
LQEAVFLKTYSIVTGYNVLEAPASNTDGFPSGDTCVYSN